MKKLYLLCLIIVSFGTLLAAKSTDLVQYVNTLQGTNSHFGLTRGNTYPTTALPFAMHTWTPQTGENGDGWKYQFFKDTIRGFQQAHQCSSWTNDYCVFSLMPVTGLLALNQFDRAAKFSHDNEVAKPNYYKVKMDNEITTEMSPTERGAHLRFSFPKKQKSYVVLDGYTGFSQVKIHPKENRITGYVRNGRGLTENLKSYFVIQFDRPIRDFGVWENREQQQWNGEREREGRGAGAWVRFDDGVTVQAKVGSSYISPEQSELNLERELGKARSLEDTRQTAWEIWNQHLNRILVEGGTEEEKATFYSCYFRAACFHPSSTNSTKSGSHTILVLMTAKFIPAICTPTPVFGIPSGDSSP